jgi:hypothetical protein
MSSKMKRERDPTDEELRAMTRGEVDTVITSMKADIQIMTGQIERWGVNATPPEMDDDWRDKVQVALSYKRANLAKAKREASRRHAINRNKPMGSDTAFKRAAHTILSVETVEQIWAVARDKFPEAFE